MAKRDLLIGGIISAGVSLTISYYVIAGQNSQSLEKMETLQEALATNQKKIAVLERQLTEAISVASQSHPAQPHSVEKVVTFLTPPPAEPRKQPSINSRSALVEKKPSVPRTVEQQLLSGGISNTDVASIVSTKRQIQESRLQQNWQYRRQAYLNQPDSFQLDTINPLRARLGDDLYEKYLRAQDRRIAVKVSGVMSQSPADIAGIIAGDDITHYDGERVFHLNELSTLTARKDLGEFVEVEILREGQKLTLTIDSGPLGVSMVGG